jgi:chromosome segregation ATPase
LKLDQTVTLTILAIVASVLSAGGIIAQVIGWKRARDERLSKEREEVKKAEAEAAAEKAKAEAEKAKHVVADKVNEREHTGRFQQTLIDRIESLERSRSKDEKRIEQLEKDNEECERRYTELERKAGVLEGENVSLKTKATALEATVQSLARDKETLRADLSTLRSHVERVEGDNRALRARLEERPESGVGESPGARVTALGVVAKVARGAREE